MDKRNTLKLTDEFAAKYDSYINGRHWYGPQVLFGLLYEFLNRGDNLLDIGIGTGLSSKLFHNYGLNIYGVDGSEEMIAACALKEFTEQLWVKDLTAPNLTFGLALYEIIVSNGVFHLIGNLGKIFAETAKVLQSNGLFAFTFDAWNCDANYTKTDVDGVYHWVNPESGVEVFKHSELYIQELLKVHSFKLIRSCKFLAFKDEENHSEYTFTVWVVQH